MESTVADFWRMIWEQCINTVVMLTNLSEEGKVKMVMTYSTQLISNYYYMNTFLFKSNTYVTLQPKCDQYWPDDVNNAITYGNISVTLLEENIQSHFTIRNFLLTMV